MIFSSRRRRRKRWCRPGRRGGRHEKQPLIYFLEKQLRSARRLAGKVLLGFPEVESAEYELGGGRAYV